MLRSVAKDTLALGLIQIAGYVLPLISLPYLTRILGKHDFGVYSIIFACTTVISVFSDYGYVTNGTRQVSINADDAKFLSKLIGAATSLRLLLNLIAVSVFLLICPLLIGRISMSTRAAIVLGTFSGSLVLPWLFQGLGKLTRYSLFSLIARALCILLTFFMVKSSKDLDKAVWFNFLPQIIGIPYFFWFLRDNGIVWKLCTEIYAIKSELFEGIHYFAPNFYSILFTNLGIITLGSFQSPSVAGAYSASERLVKAVSSLSGAVNQAVYPKAASEMHKSTLIGTRFIINVARYVIPVFMLLSLILIMFGGNLVSMLFGSDYKEVSKVMLYLPLYIILANGNTFIGVIYMTNIGKEKEYGIAFLYGTLVAIAIYCLLPKYISYNAPALGLVVGELVIFLCILVFIRR